jgi:PAS domain S-box-containing protein
MVGRSQGAALNVIQCSTGIAWWEAIETSMDAFWLVDPTGRLLEVNNAYVQRSGYSRDQLLAMRITDFDAVERPEETAAHIQRILHNGYDRFETLHRARDGSLWPVEVAASWVPTDGGRMLVFLRDITERLRSERALRESEELNRRIIASSADCIKVLGLDGRLISMSEGGRRLLEIEDFSRYGDCDWVQFWQEHDQPEVTDALHKARSGGLGQFRAYCPSEKGTPKWWDVLITPILGSDGSAEKLLAVSRDITERKLFEDALSAAKAEAERANNAKSRFLAATGHDLRQPFQAMRLLFEALRPHVAPSGAAVLGKLDEAMHSGERLLSALLDVSLLEVGMVKINVHHFPIDDVLESLVAECAPQAQAKGLRLRHVRCSAMVRSDPVMLARILRNLILNAIRYTERGGLVVGCRRKGESLAIQVCDSGIGVAAADIPRLFEEFYQVGNGERDKTKGLGLGLAVVAKTARLLEHTVDVRSQPGRGSAFSVTVPGINA